MGKGCYLVTGGAGFIGSHIVERLLKMGESVRVLDNFYSGKESNLAGFKGDLEVIRGDIRDIELLGKVMKGVAVAFHQAALGSVPRSVEDPVSTHDSNVNGTMNVLLAARNNSVRRVLFASSSSVYGDTPTLPKTEDMTPKPLSPYALSKLVGEHYCSVFFRTYGLETVALRYFNIFGARQNPESDYAAVLPRFITALLENRAPTIYGDGLQSRDFTYVDNVVDANLKASEADGVAGNVYNIACGSRYSLLDILAKLKEILSSSIEPIFEPARRGDVRDSMASVDLARNAFGYKSVTSFEDGLRKTIEWYASQTS